MKPPTQQMKGLGRDFLRKGSVCSILLAAGDGSRLGFSQPKGFFPISLYRNKSLLQILLEKIHAKEKMLDVELKVGIMCSENNRQLIAVYLEQNKFFGLKNVILFTQTDAPLFQRKGKKLMPLRERSPDGNGSLFSSSSHLFLDSSHVTVTPIDNPLADPFDEGLIGFHLTKKMDVSLIAIREKHKTEKMGGVFMDGEKVHIVEYMDLKKTPTYFNTGLFCFSRDFMKKVANRDLPYHWVKKRRDNKTVYKQEKFLFDALLYAQKSGAILYERKNCFAALKKKRGEGGVRAVKEALLKQHKSQLELLTRRKQKARVELAPDLFFPSENLVKEWRGKFIIRGQYIENKG